MTVNARRTLRVKTAMIYSLIVIDSNSVKGFISRKENTEFLYAHFCCPSIRVCQDPFSYECVEV